MVVRPADDNTNPPNVCPQDLRVVVVGVADFSKVVDFELGRLGASISNERCIFHDSFSLERTRGLVKP